MLVRDSLTGFLHEVPDYRLHGARYGQFHQAPDLSQYDAGEMVYDGLGNPVGFLPALASLIGGALPSIGKLVSGFLPGLPGSGAPAPAVAAACPACPPCPTCPTCGAPALLPAAPPMPAPAFPYPAYARRRRR